jgi:hypothetical protein
MDKSIPFADRKHEEDKNDDPLYMSNNAQEDLYVLE